jgi:hypothetical protein
MRRPLRLWVSLFLAGCGQSNQVACTNPALIDTPPQDCGTLSSASWRVGPYPTSSQPVVRLAVGQSRALWLDPFVETQCVASVASVTWTIDDPSSASVVAKEPAYRGSWVTGLGAGANGVRARIILTDGTMKETDPRAIEVTPQQTPEGAVPVARGAVDLGAYRSGAGTEYRRYVPFTLPSPAARLHVSVNWNSPLNGVSFALEAGECDGGAAAPCAGGLKYIGSPNNDSVKPVTFDTTGAPAGIYTLRIDNLGAEPETATYEVWTTPS